MNQGQINTSKSTEDLSEEEAETLEEEEPSMEEPSMEEDEDPEEDEESSMEEDEESSMEEDEGVAICYKPPEDFVLAKTSLGKSLFENERNELWLIRVPDDISERDLVGSDINIGSNGLPYKRIGTLTTNTDNYSIYHTKSDENFSVNQLEGAPTEALGVLMSMQEMTKFQCAIPEIMDGAYKLVSKPFAHFLTITRAIKVSNEVKRAEEIKNRAYKPREQPPGLKMRFFPYGSKTGDQENLSEFQPWMSSSVPKENNIDNTSKKEKKDRKDKKDNKEKETKNNNNKRENNESESVPDPALHINKKKRKAKEDEVEIQGGVPRKKKKMEEIRD